MANSNRYFIWNKNEDIKISKNFNTKEFQCQCSRPACVEQRISLDLIEKLEQIRSQVGQPLIVTSGYRCFNHQQDLKDKGTVATVIAQKSTHVLGDAADIKIPKNNTIEQFLEKCEPHFESIGVANTFLHLDLRKGKRRWNY
jgi:uncharacterized protein YcbK (DUF882 family)